MSKPKVFVTRSILDAGLDIVRDFCEADIWSGELPPPREVLLERVKGVEGILSLLTSQIDDEVIAAAGTNLKVISNYAVGYDNIDIPAATRRGVPVGNTPGVLTDTTADFAFALLLALATALMGNHMIRTCLGGSDVARDAEEATERFRAAAGLEEDDGAASGPSEDDRSLSERAVEAALAHPDTVAGVALALAGILGPMRAMKLVARGTAVMGTVGSVVERMHRESGHEKSPESRERPSQPQWQENGTRK